jgi:hypothetical protein
MSTDEWCTPKFYADKLGRFDVDIASNARSHIQAAQTFALDHVDPDRRDALACAWPSGASLFVNWPYSNPLPWALRLRDHDGPWCVLAKLDPTTRWHAALMEACPTVAPFRKRLKFEGEEGSLTMTANFPSVLIYSAWRPPAALVPHLWLPTYAAQPVSTGVSL